MISISITGSPSSGKSAFSAALASEFSYKNQKTVIVNNDIAVPMLKIFNSDTEKDSLNKLLEDNDFKAEDVAKAVCLRKDDAMTGIIAYSVAEKFIAFTEQSFERMKNILDNMVDVVIFDGGSLFNDFEKYSLKSDVNVIIITPDSKGVIYFEQNKDMILSVKNKKIFLGMAKPYHAIEEVKYIIGQTDGILPFSKDIECAVNEGRIFDAGSVCHEMYSEALEKVVLKAMEKV